MATVTKPRTGRPAAVVLPPVGDLLEVFAKRNPRLPRAEMEAPTRLTAAFLNAAAQLTPKMRQSLMTHLDGLPRLIADVASALASAEPKPGARRKKPRLIAKEIKGEGLDQSLDPAEATRLLDAFVSPGPIEYWAGEVAGPEQIERELGISRSTLHDWRKRQAVIGLLSGVRKHVFPVAQFVDGRPIEGLARVAAAAGSPRTAWLWLIEPHPSLRGRRPLDRLRAGEIDRVTELAESDFGQP